MKAYAHRGGGCEAEENTWEAVDHTVNLGYRYLETDLHLTLDGVIVMQHDATLDRPWGRRGRVSDLTWGEFATLRGGRGGRPIRLIDALATYPHLELNVDAKSDRVVPALIDFINTHPDYAPRLTVASFKGRRLAQIRAATGVATSLGPAEVARLVAAGVGRIDPARCGVPGPEQNVTAAQVPTHQYGIPIVTRGFIAAAHRRGLEVHVWTVDDPTQMRHLIDLGVDGIITDRPTTLRALLQRRGLWEGA